MYVLLLFEANVPEDLMILRSELSSFKAKTVGEIKIASPPDSSKISPNSEELGKLLSQLPLPYKPLLSSMTLQLHSWLDSTSILMMAHSVSHSLRLLILQPSMRLN